MCMNVKKLAVNMYNLYRVHARGQKNCINSSATHDKSVKNTAVFNWVMIKYRCRRISSHVYFVCLAEPARLVVRRNTNDIPENTDYSSDNNFPLNLFFLCVFDISFQVPIFSRSNKIANFLFIKNFGLPTLRVPTCNNLLRKAVVMA